MTASSGNSLELGNASVILDLPRLRFFIKRALFIVEETMNVEMYVFFFFVACDGILRFVLNGMDGIIKIRNNIYFFMKHKIIIISFSPLFKITCDGLNFPVISRCERYFSKLKIVI